MTDMITRAARDIHQLEVRRRALFDHAGDCDRAAQDAPPRGGR